MEFEQLNVTYKVDAIGASPIIPKNEKIYLEM